MGAEKRLSIDVRELMQRAMREQLSVQQVSKITEALDEDPKLVHKCGLTPKKLPELVGRNPQVAIDVLLKLVSST
jgi:hypothetical protein